MTVANVKANLKMQRLRLGGIFPSFFPPLNASTCWSLKSSIYIANEVNLHTAKT